MSAVLDVRDVDAYGAELHPPDSRLPAASPPEPTASSRAPSWGASASLVTVATVVLSLGNYSYSFLVVHLLNAREFARFSAAQGLLLVLGSGCMAAIPWAMARFIAERPGRRARQEAMHFGLIASALQGIVFAAVAGSILWLEAGAAVGIVVATSAFIGSLMAVPIGFLQGVDRIRAIVVMRVLEFVVRFGTGILILVVVSHSATAALIGYPIGAIVMIAAGLSLCRSGLPPFAGEQPTIRGLARQSANLGAIQVFLSMLGALDTVSALAAHLSTNVAASYQSAALLGRIPIFLSASIGLAAYVHVVQARNDAEVRTKMGQAVRLYTIVVIPMVIACLTVPDALMHLLIPARYGDATMLLRFTVVSGAAVGWIDVVSTAHQARTKFRPAIRILGVAAVAQPIVLICAGQLAGIWLFASALVLVSLAAAAFLSIDARIWLPTRVPLNVGLIAAAALAAAIALHGIAPAWIALIVLVAAVAVRALLGEIREVPAGAMAAEAPVPSPQPEEIEVTVTPERSAGLGLAPDPPRAPRVLLVGDSWINGLGVREPAFGAILAAELEAEALLDISAVSKPVSEMRADAAAIRDFGPDLAVLLVGGTESLVIPRPVLQRFVERFGPDSWKGLSGLEPRAVYSQDHGKRRRQQLTALAKHVVKVAAIRLTGGGRRFSLREYKSGLDALIAVLEDLECQMVFVAMIHTDDRLFPFTGEAMADTQVVLEATVQGRSDARVVDVNPALDFHDDFLADHLHLTAEGHRRVAAALLPCCRDAVSSMSASASARPAQVS